MKIKPVPYDNHILEQADSGKKNYTGFQTTLKSVQTKKKQKTELTAAP